MPRNSDNQENKPKPVGRADATFHSDLPLSTKVPLTMLHMVSDNFKSLIDRRDVRTNARTLRDFVETINEKNRELLDSFEQQVARFEQQPQTEDSGSGVIPPCTSGVAHAGDSGDHRQAQELQIQLLQSKVEIASKEQQILQLKNELLQAQLAALQGRNGFERRSA